MVDLLNTILENSSLPFVTAFVLGLMTAISPCPLATNITAVGYIGKEIENRQKVFINGLVYTLGRAITYCSIALVIYIGADKFKISDVFLRYGEKFLGPALILIGLFMLQVIKIRLPEFNISGKLFKNTRRKSYLDVLFMGIVFALAFCPYSGVIYFGMLIPITVTSVEGLYLPLVFAIATGIPVIIFAYLIAFTISGVGRLYDRLKIFELWFRRIISILFITVGVYYITKIYLL